MALSKLEMTDVHMLALDSGAVYHQEKGQQVGSYTFTVEGLASMLQSVAINAVEHISEFAYLKGVSDENQACERICLEPANIAGTKLVIREHAAKIAARRRAV